MAKVPGAKKGAQKRGINDITPDMPVGGMDDGSGTLRPMDGGFSPMGMASMGVDDFAMSMGAGLGNAGVESMGMEPVGPVEFGLDNSMDPGLGMYDGDMGANSVMNYADQMNVDLDNAGIDTSGGVDGTPKQGPKSRANSGFKSGISGNTPNLEGASGMPQSQSLNQSGLGGGLSQSMDKPSVPRSRAGTEGEGKSPKSMAKSPSSMKMKKK